MSEPRLLLASTSKYRRELLGRLRRPFDCVAPQVDEDPLAGESVESMTARLAVAKARAVAKKAQPGAIVIGSDQAASLGGRMLGKPGGRERAIEQLLLCSGQSVSFHTAVCVIDAQGRELADLDTTVVRFRALSDAEVARYIDAEQPFDCAGSFKCEGLGITLFEAIDSSDPTALIGLPLIRLCGLLRQAGIALP